MVARLTSDDPAMLDQEGDRLEADRGRMISELSALQRALIDARQDEYRDLIVDGMRSASIGRGTICRRNNATERLDSRPYRTRSCGTLSDGGSRRDVRHECPHQCRH
jgi:hypothetical protein